MNLNVVEVKITDKEIEITRVLEGKENTFCTGVSEKYPLYKNVKININHPNCLNDSKLLDIALEMLSDYQECEVNRENLKEGFEHHKNHCIKCGKEYNAEYLAEWGMCCSCYADMVGAS